MSRSPTTVASVRPGLIRGSRTGTFTEQFGDQVSPGTPPLKLVVLDGQGAGTERPLVSRLTVGADPTCDLPIPDRGVSREHAVFDLRGGRAWVRDCGSRNGTFVNHARVSETELPLGAVVNLGKTPIGVFPRWHVTEVEPLKEDHFGHLFGVSRAAREAFAVLQRVATSDATLLLEGESGTGKELAARSVHEASSRSGKPYLVFDCTTVTRELVESELFGHRRGAFTGAVSDRMGAFQQAAGGTLFLDEVGELPADLQPKLLRVLETGEVKRVGDTRSTQPDVRVIAATNRNLGVEARRDRFRGDLLYRLAVVRVQLPPLRARPEDIALIVEKLIGDQLADGSTIAGPNLERLVNYSWPGNVRELRNVLTRALALSPRVTGAPSFDQLVFNLASDASAPATLGFSFPGVESPLPYKEARQSLLAQFEGEYVQALMRRHGDNVTEAARAAGVSRKHIHSLLKRIRSDSGS